MAKQTALGDALYVGASDLSGDVGSISSIASPRAIIDVSSIAVSGYERLLGRADGSINFAAFYNPFFARICDKVINNFLWFICCNGNIDITDCLPFSSQTAKWLRINNSRRFFKIGDNNFS